MGIPGGKPVRVGSRSVPVGLADWALAAVGMILLIVGIMLHVVATSQCKQAYREIPVLLLWPGAQPMRRG